MKTSGAAKDDGAKSVPLGLIQEVVPVGSASASFASMGSTGGATLATMPNRIWIALPALAVLEELHGSFVLLGSCARSERAEITPPSGAWIALS